MDKETDVIRPPDPDPISPEDEETDEQNAYNYPESFKGGQGAGTITNTGVPTSAEAQKMFRAGDPEVPLVHAGEQRKVDLTRTPPEPEPYFKDIGMNFASSKKRE